MTALEQDKRWLKFVDRYCADLPRFAIEVVGLELSAQQFVFLQAVQVSRSRVSISSGHGCFAKGTSIMLSTGECVPVESVKKGDKLMGGDGNSFRRVLRLRRGTERMYQFTYSDGTSHIFNESHILCLVATNSKGTRVAGNKTTATVRDWLEWGYDKKRCHAIYRSPVTNFSGEKKELLIPPYILGAWLGDGTSARAEITNMDSEVNDEWSRYIYSIGCNEIKNINSTSKSGDICYAIAATKGDDIGDKNHIENNLKKYNLLRNKHIPDDYLFSSVENRLELLAGLIDTDGSLDGGGYDFVQKNKLLAHQTAWLARSVGCHATLRMVTKKCTNNGVVGNYWRVTIGRNAGNIPVRIERKKRPDSLHNQRTNLHFGIKSCIELGEGDYYGFELDGDNKFLGGDFTVLHNTGKTKSLSVITLWHLLCYYNSVTLITANDADQLRATLWKEIATSIEHIGRGVHSWIYPHIELLANGVMRIKGHEKTWMCESKTASSTNSNRLAGRHGKWFLIIADEASTVPDEVLTTLTGALTEQHNRMILTSQPTRNAGYFWRTQNEICTDNGGDWKALVFSSFDSPWVSDEWLKSAWEEYDTDERAVRLLGEFPQDSSKVMMSLTEANSMYKRGRIIQDHEPYGWLLLADIASGEGLRDKSACVIARVIGYGNIGEEARRVEVVVIPLLTNNIRSNMFASYLIDAADPYPSISYVVDAGGLGVNVCQDLEDKNVTCHRVWWGAPCFKEDNRKRYLNLRAQAMHQAARAAKDGRLSVLCPDFKRVMVGQSSRIPKTFADSGRMKVPSKGTREWEGLASPDLWDAVCFAFLDNVQYIVSENNYDAKNSVTKVTSFADDFFASV
jgi:hypothetical protein